MADYCNKKQREILGFVAGFEAYLEELKADGINYLHECSGEVDKTIESCTQMINTVLGDIAQEQRNRIARQLNNQRLAMVYKESPVLQKEWALIETDVLQDLVTDAWSECFMCGLTGKEAKNCPKRKLLFRAMATPTSKCDKKGDCPWRRS